MLYYKGREHEDNLKVQLFVMCQKEGIKLELEHKYKNCRFDGVVVREQRIIAIVEVKNWTLSQAMKYKKESSEQLKKYSRFGVPVLVLWSFNGIYRAMDRIRELVLFHDCGDRRNLGGTAQFFPRAKKSGRRKKNEELAKLIKQQENDDKYHTRMFGSN